MPVSEADLIAQTPTPLTREMLVGELKNLGLQPGMIVIVHSSLKALGWVNGGAVTVIQALMDVITPAGTIVMPAHTGNYSDPANWENPPVPQPWWDIIYQAMPAFDPAITPTYFMGTIAETFRTWPGVIRSNHPQVSFTAWGKDARYIIDDQALEYGLGEESPLARIYDLSGWVLLLGVGHASNTSLHLAEYRAPNPVRTMLGSPVINEHGVRVWQKFVDIEIDSGIFPTIGDEFEQKGLTHIRQIGLAEVKIFPQRAAVDFALGWYRRTRIV